jgi:hypothetical protein
MPGNYSLVFFVEFVRAVLVFGGALWTLRDKLFLYSMYCNQFTNLFTHILVLVPIYLND